MGEVLPNIGIYVPANGERNYGASFANGMRNVDNHDHSGAPNKGLQLGSGSIATGAITEDKLATSFYEEGVFTPALDSTGINVTYTTQSGRYTRIGNKCFFSIKLTFDVITNPGAGAATITGLPFTVNASSVDGGFAAYQNLENLPAGLHVLNAIPTPSTTTIELIQTGGATAPDTAVVPVATKTIQVSGFFEI